MSPNARMRRDDVTLGHMIQNHTIVLFFPTSQLASMVSYSPLDFDEAAEAAAVAAAVAARGATSTAATGTRNSSSNGAAHTHSHGAIDESKLRKVLYVSGEEKDVHVSEEQPG